MRNRRNRRTKKARIDTVLKASEIDVFAGYAEEIFHTLSDDYEMMTEKASELAEQLFFSEK